MVWFFLTLEALVGFAQHVLNGDFDVFECDVCRATAPYALAIHSSCADTLAALDQEKTDTAHSRTAGPHGCGEVVAPDAVGDPFLLAVDYI